MVTPNCDQHPLGRIAAQFKEFLLLRQEQGRLFFPGKGKNAGGVQKSRQAGEGTPSLASLVQAIACCKKCRLSEQRTQGVPGQGSLKAWLMVVGEGPGYEEDQQGRPFVGPAGELLTRMLKAIELNREDVYISNVVKCRPPENRVPREDEVQSCFDFLREEINCLRPKLILALGGTAAQTLARSKDRISQLRKRDLAFEGIPIKASYHPAYLLRNPEYKKEAWEDLKEVRRFCHELAGKK